MKTYGLKKKNEDWEFLAFWQTYTEYNHSNFSVKNFPGLFISSNYKTNSELQTLLYWTSITKSTPYLIIFFRENN